MSTTDIPICEDHDFTQFEETYYGYSCPKCRLFIPFGCEPWAPEDGDLEEEDIDS